MNSPSLPEPFITAKGSSCGLEDRIWGISSGGGADTPGERIKKEGGELGFLSPPPPSPSCCHQASHPTPSPKAWPLQVSGNCSLQDCVDKQAGQRWVVTQTTDPRTSSQSWQQQSWASASVWEKPSFSLEINSFLACLRLTSSLWLTELLGIWSQGPLCLLWLPAPLISCLPT